VAGFEEQVAAGHVFADLDHVLAGGDGAQHLDRLTVDVLGVLDHDHGVGAGREHPPGGDADRLAQARPALAGLPIRISPITVR